jgi:putative polyketide hydroxylase
LLAGAESNALRESARAASKRVGIDLDIYSVGTDGLADPSAAFAAAYGIDANGAVLVRPDGFVAWRAKEGNGVSTEQIERVLATVLSR